MADKKNLCAMIPANLHARVRLEQEQSGKTLSEFVEQLITDYYKMKEGTKMTGDNLNAKATLWLWQLRDLAVIGIGLLIAVLALTQLGLFLPMVLVAAYAFLSIHLDGLSVLDFLSFVVSFYITEQQIFEWEEPV